MAKAQDADGQTCVLHPALERMVPQLAAPSPAGCNIGPADGWQITGKFARYAARRKGNLVFADTIDAVPTSCASSKRVEPITVVCQAFNMTRIPDVMLPAGSKPGTEVENAIDVALSQWDLKDAKSLRRIFDATLKPRPPPVQIPSSPPEDKSKQRFSSLPGHSESLRAKLDSGSGRKAVRDLSDDQECIHVCPESKLDSLGTRARPAQAGSTMVSEHQSQRSSLTGPVSSSSATPAGVRADLRHMQENDLKRKANEIGVDTDKLLEAMDADNPQETLLELVASKTEKAQKPQPRKSAINDRQSKSARLSGEKSVIISMGHGVPRLFLEQK
jgi:hypothetical protein